MKVKVTKPFYATEMGRAVKRGEVLDVYSKYAYPGCVEPLPEEETEQKAKKKTMKAKQA